MQMTLDVNFGEESLSGTLAGTLVSPDSVNCISGDGAVIDIFRGEWRDVFSGSVGGGVDPNSGAFSGSVTFTHSWSFTITQYFTEPSCVHLNAELTVPPPGSHGGSGTISGTASQGGAASFTISTDHGPGSWSGTGVPY